MTPGTPTLEMVAAAAGVSRATVSRVVNGSPKVSPQVVDAVNRAIVALNYVPNRAARTLASRQAMAIALLVPEDIGRFYADPYFASVVKGITERLEPTDYVLNLLVSSSDPRHKTRRYLAGGSVDGALVVSHHAGDRDLIELSDIVPTVFGGDPTTMLGLRDRFYVDVDNVGGARAATRHLIRLGRRRIGTVTGAMDMHAATHRLAGWRDVMSEAGLDDTAVAHGDFTSYGGADAMRDLLARRPDIDAVFVANDLMARGALITLGAAGRRVPEDVALIGFDDSFAATNVSPGLTTVRQAADTMGWSMADMLLELLAGREPETRTRILPTTLVLRETA
ncbi:LacI family DNA-binding transcriptional regulator [Microlunatus ginsengisoli]|jgi:LacI family transcriptional regulator|uniref:LacI family DNA-binding transcriptional regulator n=1 Tax=Microlunatus ginsengisoli TaxID=363863 RepID=A0ABP7AM17_9ACTN